MKPSAELGLLLAGLVVLTMKSGANAGPSPRFQEANWEAPGRYYSYSFSQVFRDDVSGQLLSSGGTVWFGDGEIVVDAASQLGFKRADTGREYLSFHQYGSSRNLLVEHQLEDPADGSWDSARGPRPLRIHDRRILELEPSFVPGISIGMPWRADMCSIGDQLSMLFEQVEGAYESFPAGNVVQYEGRLTYSRSDSVAEAYFLQDSGGRIVTRVKVGQNRPHGLLRVRCFDEAGLFLASEMRNLRSISREEFASVAALVLVDEVDKNFLYRSGSSVDARIVGDKRVSDG